MKIQAIVLTCLAISSCAAFADPSPLTRAEVRQQVIAARAAGQLIPAGEGEYPVTQPTTPSTLTRKEVRAEVLEARAAGDLIPAGEGDDAYFARSQPVTASDLTRGDVRQATREARREGELIPAGNDDETALARDRTQTRYAQAALITRKSARKGAANG